MSRVLLITEKPGISDNVSQGLSNVLLKDKKVDTVFIYPVSWWQWKIAKKTPLRKIPSTPDPKDMTLKLHPAMNMVPYGQIHRDEESIVVSKRNGFSISDFRKILIDRWSEYEKVICIPENDRNGWGSLIRWFRWFSEVDENLLIGKDIRCLMPEDFSVQSVEESYHKACSLNNNHVEEMSRQFEFKHLFDAWFNLNSATVFGIAQKKAGVESQEIVTKYEIMTLHAIHKGEHLHLKAHDILHGMKVWCGSGAYKAKLCREDLDRGKGKFACLAFEEVEHRREAPYEYLTIGIGSDTSRDTILQKLIFKKMIVEGEDEIIRLTEIGRRFLERCHFGTFDPDLPFRLERWIKYDDIEGVKRYIRRYFSRQKRYVI